MTLEHERVSSRHGDTTISGQFAEFIVAIAFDEHSPAAVTEV